MIVKGNSEMLKMLMLMNGYSLKKLSEKSGVSYSTVRSVIIYDRQTTSETALKIAMALGKDVTELFSIKEVKENVQ